VNQVLSEVEAVVQEKFRVVTMALYCLIFFFILLFVGFGTLGAAGPGFAFGGFFGIFFLIIFAGCLSKKRTEEARIIVHQIFDVHNARLKEVGLRWNVPVHFPSWIELNNDFRTVPGYVVGIVQPMPVLINQPVIMTQPTMPMMQQNTFAQPQFQQGYYVQGNNGYYPPQQTTQF